ncbi:MAG: alpha/beta fold hydrolase [Actinomycetota bacterium]
MIPETKYAKSGDVHIAYQQFGDGALDLVLVPGFTSHVELTWETPPARRFFERLGSFARVIIFDKRGTGLSDPVVNVPTLEQRVDDVRAVMDDAGVPRAAFFTVSEGAAMGALLAATDPDRVQALALYGGMARSTEAPDYPYAPPLEAIRESMELLGPDIYKGVTTEIFSPSIQDDPAMREAVGRYIRNCATPSMLRQLQDMFLDIDIRPVLSSIRVPTLVLHRRGDRAVSVYAGRYLAEHIEGARFVELPGNDHVVFGDGQDLILDALQEFLTGVRPAPSADRVLATVMFTDIVGSTERAASVGDQAWRDLLEAQEKLVRQELQHFNGREIKTIGDGFLAIFDGPARAIRCGVAIARASQAVGVPVRVGLHTGECEVTAADVGGIAVHIASRVSSIAGAQEVLVSRTVKDLVAGSGITFADRGVHTLKGVPDEWQIYSVTSA